MDNIDLPEEVELPGCKFAIDALLSFALGVALGVLVLAVTW